MEPIRLIKSGGYGALAARGCDYLCRRGEELRARYRLSGFKSYAVDHERGTIVFSNDGVPGLVADVCVVGSLSDEGTWLWSWGDDRVPPGLSRPLLAVRLSGRRRRIAQLVHPCWSADDQDAWDMTSISAYLLSAEGMYVAQDQRRFTYMLLSGVGRPPRREIGEGPAGSPGGGGGDMNLQAP